MFQWFGSCWQINADHQVTEGAQGAASTEDHQTSAQTEGNYTLLFYSFTRSRRTVNWNFQGILGLIF